LEIFPPPLGKRPNFRGGEEEEGQARAQRTPLWGCPTIRDIPGREARRVLLQARIGVIISVTNPLQRRP